MITAPKNAYGPNLFKMFVHELGGPRKVAEFLDVTERTVWRWLSEESAPKMAVLALYWETHYGKSLIDTDQVNEIRLLYQYVNLLQNQFTRAKDIVTGLKALHAGSSNEAVFDELPNLGEFPQNRWGTAPAKSIDSKRVAAG